MKPHALKVAHRTDADRRAAVNGTVAPGWSPVRSEKHRRVLRVALSVPLRLDPWQEVVRGVYRYGEANKFWSITFHTDEDVSGALADNPDGVIAMVRTADAAAKLQAWGGPVVDAAGDLDRLPFVQVGFDALATGKLAAEHLALLKGRAYCFAGREGSPRSRQMRQGFVERLAESGCTIVDGPEGVDAALRPTADATPLLRDWLARLPRPAAVFAESDQLAHRIAAACQATGVKVPQDLSILGCMNDEFICGVSHPPLSSIRVPVPAIGHEAARLLDSMMASVAVPARLEVPPHGLVTRQSTDPAALAEPALAAALLFIRENATRRIGVDHIAAASGLSRSSLERRFRAVLGRSPLAELLRERVDRARSLLVDSDMTMKEVATASGFHDLRHLAVTFRQKLGVTPGKFRARYRLQ